MAAGGRKKHPNQQDGAPDWRIEESGFEFCVHEFASYLIMSRAVAGS